MTRLDLHGIKHEYVYNKIIRFIEKHWDTEQQLTIITGHSSKMKKIVITALDEYGLEYYIGGVLGISDSFLTFYSGCSSD
jgi:biotin synthase-like enzyme